MGIFDDFRNQNIRITYSGDRNRAAAFAPKAKQIIERAQGLLDLGVNLGFTRSTRFVLDNDTVLDLKITDGVTSPMVSGNITAKTPTAVSGAVEVKNLVEAYCPPLPEPQPGRRMFTQLFDGSDRSVPENDRAFRLYDSDTWQSFGSIPYSCTYEGGNTYTGTHQWMNVSLSGLSPVIWRGQERDSFVSDDNFGLFWGTKTGRFEIAPPYFQNGAPCNLGCLNSNDCGPDCGGEDCRNYIHALAGSKFGTGAAQLADEYRIRFGTGLQFTDVTDSLGNAIAIERTAHVFQRRGSSISKFVDRNGNGDFTGDFNTPDVEIVFLQRDPFYGCGRALGIFYNADDGVGLFGDDQGAWTSVEGLRGWGDTFGQDLTPDSYDLNWFCQNANRLFPLLGPPTFLGTFPRLMGLQIMGSDNSPIAYASPTIVGGLGYANAAYAGRSFWMYLDGDGFFTGDAQVSQNIYYETPGTAEEITFVSK